MRRHESSISEIPSDFQWVAKAVNMIDPEPGDHPLFHQADNHLVRGFKNHWIFDAHTHKIRDGEEPPIVNSFIDILPVGQNISLFRQQTVKVAKTAGLI